MNTLIICRGLPGAGKTTYATGWVANAPERRSRVNRDTIRKTYFNLFWGDSVDEAAVTDIAMHITERLMLAGRDLIVDDTNLAVDRLAPLLDLAARHGYDADIRDFDVPVDELMRRDQVRDKPVGAGVIQRMWEQYFIDGRLPQIEADLQTAP